MGKKSNYTKIYVAPEFKRILKTEAAIRGKNLIQFTRDLAKEGVGMRDYFEDLGRKKEKKYGFKEFRL
mgnify:CR=1 FL=1|jgi:hypothetical protein|tara:strand:+ start:238 stop:441 length:204 start_codon:yes stop_codon:yes gene_type:complete